MRQARRFPANVPGALLALAALIWIPALADAAQAAASPGNARVRETLKRVLSNPEYRRFVREERAAGEPGWLDRFLEWLREGERSDRRGGRSGSGISMALGGAVQTVLYILVGIAALLVAFLIIKAILDRADSAKGAGAPDSGGAAQALDGPPGEHPWDEYLREARALAERGEHRQAVRLLLLAAMSWIERHGLIRHRRGLTNRDYLRAVWRREPCREAMAAIIDVFDRIYFGRRPATPESFELCVERFQGGFLRDEKSGPVAI